MLAGTGHETGGAVATAVQPAQRSESDYNLGHPPDLRTSDSSSATSNDRFTGQSCAKPYGSEGRGSPKPNNGIATLAPAAVHGIGAHSSEASCTVDEPLSMLTVTLGLVLN